VNIMTDNKHKNASFSISSTPIEGQIKDILDLVRSHLDNAMGQINAPYGFNAHLTHKYKPPFQDFPFENTINSRFNLVQHVGEKAVEKYQKFWGGMYDAIYLIKDPLTIAHLMRTYDKDTDTYDDFYCDTAIVAIEKNTKIFHVFWGLDHDPLSRSVHYERLKGRVDRGLAQQVSVFTNN
jgi:hypothetical protein